MFESVYVYMILSSKVGCISQALSLWEDVIPGFVYNPGSSFFALMVPTLDTTRLGFLMEIFLEVERSVLFQGVSGVGKSAIIMDLITRIRETKSYMSIVLNFSAQTTAIATQVFLPILVYTSNLNFS